MREGKKTKRQFHPHEEGTDRNLEPIPRGNTEMLDKDGDRGRNSRKQSLRKVRQVLGGGHKARQSSHLTTGQLCVQ